MSTFPPLMVSDAERAELLTFVHRRTTRARSLTRARLLLQADAGWRDAQIIAAFDVSRETVSRVRARGAVGGVADVLTDQRQTPRRRAQRAASATPRLALACTAAPVGHDHWTLRRLAGKLVALGFVEHIAPETIRSLRPTTRAHPGNTRRGVSRP